MVGMGRSRSQYQPPWFFGSSPIYLMVWTCFDVAPARGHPAKTKTAGISLPFTILLPFRKETRGERDGPSENGRSPHWAQRKNCLFWRAGCPLAGAGDPCSFFEKKLFSFSTKWEMIHISLGKNGTKE